MRVNLLWTLTLHEQGGHGGMCLPGGIWLCFVVAVETQSRMKTGHPKGPAGPAGVYNEGR